MIKRIAHIVLSLWLAIILLFGSTPKEFIHLFADHTDTIHSHLEKDGLVIEPEHHHCSFLSYALPLFIGDNDVITFHFTKQEYPAYCSIYVADVFKTGTLSTFLRGPPTV